MFMAPVEQGSAVRRFVARWLDVFVAEVRLVASRPWSVLWLVGVLCADAFLVGLDSAFRYAVLDGTELPNWFNLSQEFGLGEIWEHVNMGIGVLALGTLGYRTRSRPAMLVTGLMAWVMGDNMLELHEASGELIGAYVPLFLPLTPGQEGEFIYLLFFAALALAVVAVTFLGKPRPVEAGVFAVAGCIMIAGGFGVFVDALHSSFALHSFMEVVLGGVEDGGEMVGLTMAGATAVALLLVHWRCGTGDESEKPMTDESERRAIKLAVSGGRPPVAR